MSQPASYSQSPPFRLTLAHLVIGGALVFVASNLLFAMSLRWLPSVILGLGCLEAAFVIIREAKKNSFLATSVHLPFFAICMATGFTLCILGGHGHIFYAAKDWLIRDAVLADLSAMPLPAYLWDGDTWILRAPIGMYVLPGALGRLAGLGAAHALMGIQNACLTGCALYLIAEAFERKTMGFLSIFILFSGLDFLAYLLFGGPDPALLHLERWNPLFQYSSFVTQIFWVPNHGLPGWWFVALLVLHLRRGGLAPILLVCFASALLWSPLSMMGALPFVIFTLLREPRKIFSWSVIGACVAGAAFLPVVAYLQVDAARVPSAWLPTVYNFLGIYLAFILMEIPHVVILVKPAFAPTRSWSGGLALSILLLLMIPLYKMGVNNDFAMRASIVPLAVVAACFAKRTLELQALKDPLRFGAAMIIVIGAITPMTEVVGNLTRPAYFISPCDLVSSWREAEGSPEGHLDHYMVRAALAPTWLVPPPQSTRLRLRETQSCWPDRPVIGEEAR